MTETKTESLQPSPTRETAPPGYYLAPAERRREGRGEMILEPDLPIIDSHHHLYDRPGARYLLDEYAADLAQGHRVVASVYVEIMAMARPYGPELMRPLGEVEFANGIAAMSASGRYGECRVGAAIIGHADLRHGDRIGELLDASMSAAPARYRGIRQIALEYDDPRLGKFITNLPPRGIFEHPGFARGLRELASRGLTFDTSIFHPQINALAKVAEMEPELPIILNHLGQPLMIGLTEDQRRDEFQRWSRDLRDLAERPNAICKLGGFGQAWTDFGFDTRPEPVTSNELARAWRPYFEVAIDAFGVDRCMMESNFPVDARSCGFVPYWNALKLVVADASRAEKESFFWRTAQRVYRISEVPSIADDRTDSP